MGSIVTIGTTLGKLNVPSFLSRTWSTTAVPRVDLSTDSNVILWWNSNDAQRMNCAGKHPDVSLKAMICVAQTDAEQSQRFQKFREILVRETNEKCRRPFPENIGMFKQDLLWLVSVKYVNEGWKARVD